MKNETTYLSKRRFNSRGMTLVEILVVTGIMSILLLGISEFMLSNAKVAANMETLADINSTMDIIKMTLKRTAICSDALNAGTQVYNAPNLVIYQPQTAHANILAQVGTRGKRWQITSLRITNAPPAGQAFFLANLQITFTHDAGATFIGGSNTRVEQFPLEMTIDTTNNRIVDCDIEPPVQMEYTRGTITQLVFNYNVPDGQPCVQYTPVSTCPAGRWRAIDCIYCTGAGCTPDKTYWGGYTTSDESGNAVYIDYQMELVCANPGDPSDCGCRAMVHMTNVSGGHSASFDHVNGETYRVQAQCVRVN